VVSDALKELREWQRQRAGEQDRAVRAAAKALKRLDDLERERDAAVGTVAAMVSELEATGVSREQVAAFLDVPEPDLSRTVAATARRRRPATSASQGLGTDARSNACPPSSPTDR